MDDNNRYPLDELVSVVKKLRSKEGCPWDQVQNHDSLKPHLIEEAYEVLETIEEKNYENLCKELGDLLLQIVFHSHLADEKGIFDINDVVKAIVHKMKHRHPHVFGDADIKEVEEVLSNWEKIKENEEEQKKKNQNSVLDGIPEGLPALMRAYKIQKKAAEVGFDWDNVEGALKKTEEEFEELKVSYESGNSDEIREELGDLIFSAVNISRFLDVEPEMALRETTYKFKKRFSYIEDYIRKNNLDWKELSLNDLDQLWEQAKISD